jgi:beta-lactamase regulating signal transducer with metallopeptidase domain
MTTFLADPTMSAALAIVLKASLLFGAAALVQGCLRRRGSAASRHFVLTLAVAGALALPMFALTLPALAVAVRTEPPARSAAVVKTGGVLVETSTASAPLAERDTSAAAPPTAFSMSGTTIAAILYVVVAFAMFMRLARQLWSVRRLGRKSSEVDDREWVTLMRDCAVALGIGRHVRLLRSREHSMPMAFGARRPAILIPAVADTWPEEQKRAVMLHELAHVTRHDCLTQALACVACAMYWFHPAAWWVARRLRIERELACDDRVIASGTQAREYAAHLLEIAYAFGNDRAPALAVSMARPRQLEGRMLAALDGARNRRVPTLRSRLMAVTIAAALLVPLAAATTTAPAPVVEDRPAAASTETVTPEPQPQLAPTLRSVKADVTDTARRIVRAATAVIRGAQDGLPGTWEIRPSKNTTDGTVHLRLVELNSSSGWNVALDKLEGLTAGQLASGGPVQFRLRRDAGTFTFEGVLRGGVGAGTFTFAADQAFPAELAKRGFARPTAQEQYQMARHDVGFALIDELMKHGYAKPETSELVRAGQHGVRADYVREMAAHGYRLGSLAPLIELRDHGVTPSYVRELGEQGYKGLSADAIRKARDHGVTPDFVRALRDAGYTSLTMEELIKARDHGVNSQYLRELADAGHRSLPLAEVIRVRDHGVSGEYIREMKQLGYGLPVAELVRARDHGVNVEFVREMAGLGYDKLPIDSLIRTRDHGVTPKYIRELKELGYERLPLEDLIQLRDHGLSADRIRAANARAGARLPVDLLRSLAAGGMR